MIMVSRTLILFFFVGFCDATVDFPQKSHNTAPSCGGGISCGNSSTSSSHDTTTGLTLDNLDSRTSSSEGDLSGVSSTSPFSRVCMVSSNNDAQDDWETATIVEDMLNDGDIPQLEFEVSFFFF
jgi:hypothetical protein